MRVILPLVLSLLAPSLLASARVSMSVEYPHAARPDDILTIVAHPRNFGPDAAQNVVVSIALPPSTSTVSRTIPSGWDCGMEESRMECRTTSMPVTPEDAAGPELRLMVALNPHTSGRYSLPMTIGADNAEPETQVIQLDVIRFIGVNNTADSGPGSLRQAILDANATCENVVCEIGFGLADGSTIAPLTPLPAITSCGNVRIGAGSTVRIGPMPIELSGENLERGNGLDVRARCTPGQGSLFVWGLAINRFPGDGVSIQPETARHETVLSNVAIGTDRTGLEARPNGSRGVTIHSPAAFLRIGGSVISGNARSGIYVTNTGGTSINGCLIGVASDGVTPLGNGASGIFVRRGTVGVDGNVIANNAHWGVSLAAGARASVIDNLGIYDNGILGIDWGLDGRTRVTDETGAPNTPVISDATYDAATNTTTVRGTIQIDRILGERYTVLVYTSHGRNRSGEVEGETRQYPYANVQFNGAPGIATWETRITGDLRGLYVTAISGVALYSDMLPYATSEFSEALTVQ